MTSNRPYLIRAIYEWISDNNLSPYLLVNANDAGAVLPMAFADDGKIVLNVAGRAVRSLELANDAVSFQARFGGQPMNVYVPMQAIMAIYAQENGQGMFFDDESLNPDDPPAGPEGSSPRNETVKEAKKPALRVVK